MRMMPSILSAPALLLPALALVGVVDGLGIPGTSHTVRGYDTEGGDEPICWRGRSDLAALSSSGTGADGGGDGDGNGGSDVPSRKQRQLLQQMAWDNKLYKNFILTGEVDLLPQCPRGLYIEGDVPTADVETVRNDVMLRTGEFHDYNVRLSIDLDVMGGDYVFSDEGPRIAVQVSSYGPGAEKGYAGTRVYHQYICYACIWYTITSLPPFPAPSHLCADHSMPSRSGSVHSIRSRARQRSAQGLEPYQGPLDR